MRGRWAGQVGATGAHLEGSMFAWNRLSNSTVGLFLLSGGVTISNCAFQANQITDNSGKQGPTGRSTDRGWGETA
jgi:phosphoribosylanthranilate isomerase